MRRVVRHAIAGATLAALGTGAVIVGLTGDPSAMSARAEQPATQASSAPAATGSRADDAALARATRRGDARLELPAAAQAAVAAARAKASSAGRTAVLEKQQQAVAAQQAKLKKKRAAKRAAKERRIRELGYEPGTTDPKEIARQLLENRFDYGAEQFDCFDNIIMRESRWDIDATNPSSGAYGIPQALPGSKMATVAGDWRTNPATQIIWAVGYMKDRYGSPCGAWGFKSANGWY